MNDNFNGAELRLARIFNGLTLEELSENVGKTRQYLHRLEVSQSSPTEQLLEDLARVLQVKKEFLIAKATRRIEDECFHFRKLFSTKAMSKQVAIAHCELTGRLVSYLDSKLKLPDLRIPDFCNVNSFDAVENAAELCRKEWGLGLGPVDNMSRLAENIGVVVTNLSSLSKDIDALSVASSRPIIVRNIYKESVCRQRFDIGHELGHLVMHSGLPTGDRVTESQANHFASALLIPRSMMFKLFPKPKGSRLDWVGIREFKMTWKVSLAAILYRARHLEIISPDQHKSGVITLRRTGEAISERGDLLIKQEPPELLSTSVNVLATRKQIYADDIASELGMSVPFLNRVIGFDMPLGPGRKTSGARVPLYVV